MDREQIAAKKLQLIKERMSKDKFSTHDTVETTESVQTCINSLHIPSGKKGKVVSVFQFVDGYDVEFKIHEINIIVGCLKDQLKRSTLLLLFICLVSCGEKKHVIKRAVDGDTFVLDNNHHVRVAESVDAPERGQPFGKEAWHFADSVLKGRPVIVRYKGKDKYNRELATIEIDGQNYGELLVKAGLAHISYKYCRNATLIHLYEQAKQEKKGLFAQPYIMPSTFRFENNFYKTKM